MGYTDHGLRRYGDIEFGDGAGAFVSFASAVMHQSAPEAKGPIIKVVFFLGVAKTALHRKKRKRG